MSIQLETSYEELLNWFLETFPSIVTKMDNCEHYYSPQLPNPYHIENRVLTHTFMVYKMSEFFSPDNHWVKWSSLLHDIGKPDSKKVDHDHKKCSFYGHEGLSAYMALDVMKKADLPYIDRLLIFKLIALHGSLFHFIKSDGFVKSDILDTFKGEKDLLVNLIQQVRADSCGRFSKSTQLKEATINFSQLPELFSETINQLENSSHVTNENNLPQLTILIGPPATGKTTWTNENRTSEIIISRDNLVEEYGRHKNLNYSDTFKFLLNNKEIEMKEISDVLIKTSVDARKNNESVIIDMTNMSKKTRKKWIHEFNGYHKKAIVFLTGLNELLDRNDIRYQKTGKFIPSHVLTTMCQSFTLPLRGEGIDEIEFTFT